ncbi:phosphatase PAP2 family protein [Clostridium uliginosum]|uniref:Undecaprenyl-diphosphatase n=1 Tax=Clostridium uliginosum TaxID=119641 RepID=A0A1I1PEH2_9CLOT|nr:phosphatase PAP2 family protein [Clostridium uliginosum]SFD05998.1 undecaprenyl-diphosphatase [Clostridium uliginosum]
MQFIQSIDVDILNFIQINLHNRIMDKIIPFITELGNGGFIWIIISLIFIFTKKYRKHGLIMMLALILSGVIGSVILKPLVGRVRPFNVNKVIELLITAPLDFSFPSGHAMSSFAAATIISKADKKLGICAFILAIAIAFSRLYLYVHYPSDVLVGGILGIVCGVITYNLVTNNVVYLKKLKIK